MRLDDERRLLALAAELSDVTTIHDVDFVLRDVASVSLEASRLRLWVIDGAMVRLVDRDHDRAIPLTDPTNLITQVLISRQPQWSPQCNLRGNGGDAVRAACIVPLIHNDIVLGALAFAFPTEHYFAFAEREHLLGVAAHVATAVMRVRPMRWPKASSKIEIIARPREVLIVDDDAYDAASLRDVIGELDYTPVVAYNVAAAMRIAEQIVAPVAFVSLGMSGEDGHEIATRLRAMPDWSSTRMIAMTRGRARTRAGTFDEVLAKPLEAETVKDQLPR